MQPRKIAVAAALAALAICCACNPRAKVQSAEQAVAVFHRQFNARQFAAMYQAAGTAVKASATQTAFVNYEADVFAKVGELKSAELFNYNVLYLLGGPQVRLDYHSTFANGPGVESFEIEFHGGQPQVTAYRIDSPLMPDKQ